MNKFKNIRFFIFTVFIALCLFLAGCSTKEPLKTGVMDNPLHHYIRGMELLEKNNYQAAEKRFQRAIVLDKQFAPALSAWTIVLAETASHEHNEKVRKVKITELLKQLDKAEKYADSKEEKFIVYVNEIQVFTKFIQVRTFMSKTKTSYKKAKSIIQLNSGDLPYYKNKYAADYFMGLAFYKALDFKNSEKLLSVVVGADTSGWQKKANTLYETLQKIVRISKGYTLNKIAAEIAIKERINRSDAVALLINEMEFDKLFQGPIPIKSKITKMKLKYIPADIKNHPFKNEILAIMKWNIRGITAKYNKINKAWLFKPYDFVERKELALTLEDILIKMLGDDSLAVNMIGAEKSSFPDVSPTAPWFNAVVSVTSRGLMDTSLSGEFEPDAPVSGVDFLSAVFKLRDALNK